MIITMASISLDGFMEGPDHDIGWHQVDDEMHEHFNAELGRMSRFIDGRRNHETMLEAWPHTAEHPEWPKPMHDFGRIWREMPKIVYSRTLDHADWNTTVHHEVVREDVLAMKAQPGGNRGLGGADLADTFRRLDLIDEYRLYVNPILLGQGKPMFQPSESRTSLRLAEDRVFGNRYTPRIWQSAPSPRPPVLPRSTSSIPCRVARQFPTGK